MDKLTDDELRAACSFSGLTWLEDGRWALFDIDDETGEPTGCFSWAWYIEDPALTSYVAEVLTAKVRDYRVLCNALRATRGFSPAECFARPPDGALIKATAAQRIRAAMAVLKP